VNVTCDKCNKRYSIADDKVRGKSVKIRCKQCQNLISVQGPSATGQAAAVAVSASVPAAAAAAHLGGASPWEEERTRAMPAMDTSSQWFAMVKGKQLGPFDVRGLEGKVKSGELTLRTYLWKQGMGDWKRASELPEVSPVFAGVSSAGATATGPTAAAAERPVSKKVVSVQRDVAVALETPSPEITGRKTNGNGNGHGTTDSSSAHQPAPSTGGTGTQPAARAKVPSQTKTGAVARAPAPLPVPVPSPEPAPTAPMPEAARAKLDAPLSDLFSDAEAPMAEDGAVGDIRSTMDGDGPGDADGDKVQDPFAALGESDPSMAPPPGEATKFFIAQAGVNKRNPPWKIALFVLGAPALIVGVLFVLSSLHIVPLEVTHTNDKGEEVKESFFSAGGVSGLKDMLSGDAKKKKEEADRLRQATAVAEARKKAQLAAANNPGPGNGTPGTPEQPDKPKTVDPALALIYGNNSNPTGPTIHVRAEDRKQQQQTDNSAAGLSAEATGKVVADKIKAFQSCIENALHRNPNLAVGPIEVIANVAPSGVVVSAEIAPKKHENSDWGTCMRDVAKRIVFPKSEGETEVRIPLKVGVAVPL
jgi:predicted Zn finger-like uncharacterized protein